LRSIIAILCFCLLVARMFPTGVVSADPYPPPGRLPVCGDQDGSETPFVLNCLDLAQLPEVQTFTVSGSGGVQITFDFVYRQASLNNELGFFLVDGLDASVDGLRPGEAGYLEAAYRRAEIIFPHASDASTPDVVKRVPGGSILMFFLVSNSTFAELQKANLENSPEKLPVAFFSWDTLNPDGLDHFVGYQHKTTGLVQFGFEDLLNGGDVDYDDVVYNVSTAQIGAAITPTTSDGGGTDFLPVAAAGLAVVALVLGGGGFWYWRRRLATAGNVVLPTRPRGSSAPVISGDRPLPQAIRANAWLEVGSSGGARYPLGDDPVTVGFTGDCSINLAGGGAGRPERVRIWRREGSYMLHKLSRFGVVTVSGRPAAAWIVLEEGDEIVLGDQRLIFRLVATADEG